VVGNLPPGHRSASSSSTFAPASSTSRDDQGSGTQAASTSPFLNASSVCAFSRFVTLTLPVRFFSANHFLSATSCVLPSCGVTTVAPLSCSIVVMSGRTTS
jgi:hypothetical protein